MMNRIFFIGPRASGKTTVGKALCNTLDARFFDTDQELEEHLGTSIATIVEKEGWAGFRQREHATLARIIAETEATEQLNVISTGGGIVLLEENRKLLKANGICIYLSVSVQELTTRILNAPNASSRPSLTGRGIAEEIEQVLKERLSLYLEVADLCMSGEESVSSQCKRIHQAIQLLTK